MGLSISALYFYTKILWGVSKGFEDTLFIFNNFLITYYLYI